jgi:hypothetical protein
MAMIERALYSTLPPISSSYVTYAFASYYGSSIGGDIGAKGGMGATMTTTMMMGGGATDDVAMTMLPYVFALHMVVGMRVVVGCSKARCAYARDVERYEEGGPTPTSRPSTSRHACAIHPRDGRNMSCMLVFLPAMMHAIMFRYRITYRYASWDDAYDLVLICVVPYALHRLLLCATTMDDGGGVGVGGGTTTGNGTTMTTIIDERWRRSLPWILRTDAPFVPLVMSFVGCIAFQHRYLVPLCARASYVFNGHDGVSSPAWASAFLSCGTALACASYWFLGRKDAVGTGYLLGEYHEDFFQLLLASSASCFGLSCGNNWTVLPVPVLFATSIALWILTRQLRYASLAAFVYTTVSSILVTYRLTFLNESVQILPGRTVVLRKFANVAMLASTWLILLVGLVVRAPGGYASRPMRKYDVTGACLVAYAIVLVVMEFALIIEPMPLYSRDNNEVGRVAVYSPAIAYLTGALFLVVAWRLRTQNLIGGASVVVATSIMVGKILAVVIESSLDAYDSLGMMYRRWMVSSLLIISIQAPSFIKPIHMKMIMHYSKKRRDPSAKPWGPRGLPPYATWTIIFYCAIVLPYVIVTAVRLVIEPLVGLLTGQGGGGGYSTSSKWSEVIGYSASLWGMSVLSMINHFLPDGGAEVWRKVSALTFVVGMFVSFAAPAFPNSSPSSSSLWEDGYAFQSVMRLDAKDDDSSTGSWGLVSAFLAIMLAISGPLELREVKDDSGRRDTRQFLRLMIFGMMFGCGLSWFIVMESMSTDIFIPIFVTTFSCMAMSTLGTVATVMGYFLEERDFVEVEQIANLWAGVGFPVFFVISSVSLSAHAYPFGIGGWASTYLSVCGLLAGAFSAMVRMREEKSPTTRGYGNMGCIISWLCAIFVIYGRYGIAGVGVVGTTSVAGIPVRKSRAPSCAYLMASKPMSSLSESLNT